MDTSRRRFIRSSMTLAGIISLPPALLSSCFTGRGKSEIQVDYIGRQEDFARYQEYFRKIRKTRFTISSLERSLANQSQLVFLDSDIQTRAAYIIMLLEKGKDILTTYPFCRDLGEFAEISEFTDRYKRMMGIMNPLIFYPSVMSLKETISLDNISLHQVRINCHPTDLVPGFSVFGTSGPAQLLQRMVTIFSGSFPVSLKGEADVNGNLRGIHIRFEGNNGMVDFDLKQELDGKQEFDVEQEFELRIQIDRGQTGWNMEIAGEGFTALADHTGLLTVNNEVEPRVSPDPSLIEMAVRDNINDMVEAVRDRRMPRVNQLDGLASVILNKAVSESLEADAWISL